jgi:hypothetical protein
MWIASLCILFPETSSALRRRLCSAERFSEATMGLALRLEDVRFEVELATGFRHFGQPFAAGL